jgi:hypothetical protein
MIGTIVTWGAASAICILAVAVIVRKYAVSIHGRLFGNYSRLLSMITTRGGADTTDIINQILNRVSPSIPDYKKLVSLKFILKNYGGVERFVDIPKEKPWSIVKL